VPQYRSPSAGEQTGPLGNVVGRFGQSRHGRRRAAREALGTRHVATAQHTCLAPAAA